MLKISINGIDISKYGIIYLENNLRSEHFKMSATITKLLNSKHVSVREVAEKSHVSESTLRKAIARPIESWSIRILDAFAAGLDKRAGDLLNMLKPQSYNLEIDDETQTIQGVFIPDKEMYFEIRGVVEASHLEGWNPTKEDIQAVLDGVVNPDPEEVKEIAAIWNSNNE